MTDQNNKNVVTLISVEWPMIHQLSMIISEMLDRARMHSISQNSSACLHINRWLVFERAH